MKPHLIVFMVVGILAVKTASTQASGKPILNKLDQLRWQNRVILVWGHDLLTTKTLFENQRDQIDERHIVWFLDTDQGLVSNYSGAISVDFVTNLRKTPRFNDATRSPIAPRVVLVGKDGGIKADSPTLDLGRLYKRIDAMPMRIQEMRATRR